MARPILSDLDFGSAAKATNLPNATNPGDAVPLSQMQALIEGNNWKDSVRAASTANINLSAPGAAIDGVNMAAGDRFLAKDQGTQTQNGIYIWNGAAVAATRSLDANTFDELEAATVRVEDGTANKGTKWAQTQIDGVIGTNNVIWVSDTGSAPAASETTSGIAEIATQGETDTGTDDVRFITPVKLKNWSGRKMKAVATIGDGSGTTFNIDHNFGTRDVEVEVYKNSGNFDTVDCDRTRPSGNRVTLSFAAAPANNALNVVIIG